MGKLGDGAGVMEGRGGDPSLSFDRLSLQQVRLIKKDFVQLFCYGSATAG